jgi:hypothetical protein
MSEKSWKPINWSEKCPACGKDEVEIYTASEDASKAQEGDQACCENCAHDATFMFKGQTPHLVWDGVKNPKLPEGTVEVWEVTPHQNSDYDSWIIAVKDDPDAKKALKYAKDTLEAQWDTAEDLETLDIKVRIKRTVAEETDLVDPFE